MNGFMQTTLQERIRERMKELRMTNAQLAAACKVKPPTSFGWASGKTKQIKAEPLLLAARALGVTPEWLSTGMGRKFPPVLETGNRQALYVASPIAGYIEYAKYDQPTREVIQMMLGLKEFQRPGAVAALRMYIGVLELSPNGQALSVAG
jgi:transcriptional regulator with XRE-family HTH domain